MPVAQLNPNGLTFANDTAANLSGDGALNFGSNTDWRANYVNTPANGMGPGDRGGILPPPQCEEEAAPAPEEEESTGILGSIWNAITDIAVTAYDFVRGFWDGLKQQLGDAVIVLAGAAGGKAALVAGVSGTAAGKVKAGELLASVAGRINGKGGGRPDMAQGGGDDGPALLAALAEVPDWIRARTDGS